MTNTFFNPSDKVSLLETLNSKIEKAETDAGLLRIQMKQTENSELKSTLRIKAEEIETQARQLRQQRSIYWKNQELPADKQKSESQVWSEQFVKEHNSKVRAQAETLGQQYVEQNLMPVNSIESPTSPIPSWFVVAHNYYLGFDSVEGALLLSPLYKGTTFQILHDRQPQTIDERKDFRQSYNFISRAEFDAILTAKPSWKVLNTAYKVGVRRVEPMALAADGTPYVNDIESRMNLDKATRVF